MHYLYILYSKKLDRYYKGQTDDVPRRVTKHNKGYDVCKFKFVILFCGLHEPNSTDLKF
jgi:predicted GIY-YIG superfamily endonuclease